MRNEHDKAEDELAAFRRFLTLAMLCTVDGSIRKGDPDAGEPDVLCVMPPMGAVAFEMTKVCSPDFERAVTRGRHEPVQALWGDADVAALLRSKVAKSYRVTCPIGLVIYDDGTIALPHGVIRDMLEHELRSIGHKGPFRRIWLMRQDKVSEIGASDVAENSKATARALLYKSTRVANRSLARFADWLMVALATATTFYVANWQGISNFVRLGYMHKAAYMLAGSLSLGVIARFLRHSVEAGLAASKFETQIPPGIDPKTTVDTYAKGLLWFPYRLIAKMKLDPDTSFPGRLAKLSQLSALFVWSEALLALGALCVLAYGFNT